MQGLKQLIFLSLLSLSALSGIAQTYPNKPVRLMVGANAGGGTDIIARMLAEKMADSLKGTFVVENKPGASNTIAADLTAKAPPDGHTLLVATNTGQAIAPHLIKLNFDPMKDLTPIGLVVTVPNVLVVGPAVPANSVKELVALMKSQPENFKYASSGVGSTQHIAGEGFDIAAGVKSIHVPYKGSSQAHLDIIAGNVQMMFDTTSSAMGQIKAGKFKPLAVTSAQRSSELPTVPTLAEAGIGGFEMTTWYGVFVTTGTPLDVVTKLQAELARILKLPDVQAKLKGLGGEPGNMSVEQFTQLNRQEFERFGKLIRQANIKMQ
ncbi:MAG: tripartite tricarboxylate transporter substrate binding protein [Burkholderiales bacterium]|nr:tripartite tricarboxylate transporter substrate binding protein [Burkholderiales bacterium]